MMNIELNGLWNFAFHASKSLVDAESSAVELSEWMCVPGCFDSMPPHYCQRGCAVYSRTFFLNEDWRSGWLRIDGMGLRGSFFMDGRPLGKCALPYTSFELECGPLSAGTHRITAFIDNNFDPEQMKLFLPYYDFYAFGGFYHGVSLRLSKTDNPLDRVLVRTLDFKARKLELEFLFKHATPGSFTVCLAFNGDAEKTYEVTGGKLELEKPELPLWSPDSPTLHTLRARIGEDLLTETFGIREIRTEGTRILLNGQPIFLKGFNRHESAPVCGAATTRQEMVEDLMHLKQLHANFIRGCHYPQSQEFLALCDRMGFLVWEESLGWGNTSDQMLDREFCDLQVEQTQLMVRNSFNHPSVIIFAFLNENRSETDSGVALCRRLAETIRAERSGRLVTFANCVNYQDRALEYMDVLTYNTYPGWIQLNNTLDPLEEIVPNQEKILKHLHQLHGQEKPIIVSEMGCCAIYGQHDEAGAQWTEEFQAGYLAKVIDTVTASPEIAGLALWQLNDAQSYHRTGANIRCKPLAQNLAGVYDKYRRPKLAVQTVEQRFKTIRNP